MTSLSPPKVQTLPSRTSIMKSLLHAAVSTATISWWPTPANDAAFASRAGRGGSRNRRPLGRSPHPARAGSPMCGLVPDRAAHLVRRPSRTALARVAHHPPRYRPLSDQASAIETRRSRHGRRHLDPAPGAAANLNIHLHCLGLDGVYRSSERVPVFDEVRAPTSSSCIIYSTGSSRAS